VKAGGREHDRAGGREDRKTGGQELLTADSAVSRSSPPVLPSSRHPFYIALAILFFSLNGWLHDLSDSFLFSAHMVQHLLLALAVAPLMIMGTPGWMLRPLLELRGVRSLARWVTRPIPAFAIFNIVVAAWHLPPLYNTAMAHHSVHIVQHLCFFGTAALFWWAIVHGRYGRIGYGVAVLFVFTTALHSGALGALFTFGSQVMYPLYADRSVAFGVNALEDQQLAGLIMWVPGGLIYAGAALLAARAWIIGEPTGTFGSRQ